MTGFSFAFDCFGIVIIVLVGGFRYIVTGTAPQKNGGDRPEKGASCCIFTGESRNFLTERW